MEAVRVQVRGPTPCCVLRTLVNFIDLYLDDRLDHAPLPPPDSADVQVDKSSVLSTVVSSSEERHHIGPVSLCDGSVTGSGSFHRGTVLLLRDDTVPRLPTASRLTVPRLRDGLRVVPPRHSVTMTLCHGSVTGSGSFHRGTVLLLRYDTVPRLPTASQLAVPRLRHRLRVVPQRQHRTRRVQRSRHTSPAVLPLSQVRSSRRGVAGAHLIPEHGGPASQGRLQQVAQSGQLVAGGDWRLRVRRSVEPRSRPTGRVLADPEHSAGLRTSASAAASAARPKGQTQLGYVHIDTSPSPVYGLSVTSFIRTSGAFTVTCAST